MTPSPSNFYGQHLAQVYNEHSLPPPSRQQCLAQDAQPYWNQNQLAPVRSTSHASFAPQQPQPSNESQYSAHRTPLNGAGPLAAFAGPQYPTQTPSTTTFSQAQSQGSYHVPSPPIPPRPFPDSASSAFPSGSSNQQLYRQESTMYQSVPPAPVQRPTPPSGAAQPQYSSPQPQYPRSSPALPAQNGGGGASSLQRFDSFGAPRDLFASSSYQSHSGQNEQSSERYASQSQQGQSSNWDGGRQSGAGAGKQQWDFRTDGSHPEQGYNNNQHPQQQQQQQSGWVPPPGATFSSSTPPTFLGRSQSTAFSSHSSHQQSPRPQYPSNSHSEASIPTLATDYNHYRPPLPVTAVDSRSSPAPWHDGRPAPSSSTSPRRPSSERPLPDIFNSSAPPLPSNPRPVTAYVAQTPRPNLGRQRPSVDSATGSWAPPGDAFYASSSASIGSSQVNGSTATLRPQRSMDRAALVQRAVLEAAGGEWRKNSADDLWDEPPSRVTSTPVPAPTRVSTSSSLSTLGSTQRSSDSSILTPASSYSSHQQPSRQPTITTTPPISASSTRSPSLSSQGSISHPAFTRPSLTSATLSPHTSLSGSGVIRETPSSSGSNGDTGKGGYEYLNPSLLSNVAVFLKDRVPRGFNLKGALEHPESFTGEQIVTTIQMALPPGSTPDRRFAVSIARSLQQSLWFHEVDWSDAPLKDDALGHAVYMFDEKADDDDFTEIPTGVLTNLTPCLSSYCGKLNESGDRMQCYSYTCPNAARNNLHRAPSMTSTNSAVVPEPVEAADDWVSSVPASVVQSVDKKELQRQLVIFELIQTEKQYSRDLELIQKAFVEPLLAAQPPIIPADRVQRFISDVLLNVEEIQKFSRVLLDGLLARQREGYVVKRVGDLVLSAVLDWGSAYLNYVSNFPLADAILKEEKADNSRFAAFVRSFADYSKDTRTGFETFHKRPPFRLLRYDLILTNIEKHSPEDDPDRANLAQAKEVLKTLSVEANKASGQTENRVVCRNFHKNMIRKAGDSLDLDLLNENRRCFQSGKVYRKAESAGFAEWTENFLILFDHYLVTSKPPRDRDGTLKYPLTRRAVPLELLQIRAASFTDPGVPRNQGFHLRSGKFGVDRSASENGTSSAAQDTSLIYPISLYQIGRNEGMLTYYVDSLIVRQNWEKKIREALELRKSSQDSHRVVRLEPLSEQTFGTNTVGSLAPPAPSSSQFGRPTCSIPLTFADGQSLVIAGCAAGLFVGFRGKEMRQVVHLTGITQCAVLQEFGFVLVLAQGALIAYSLEALIPSGKVLDAASKTPQRLSGKQPVVFFRVGKVGDQKDANPRTLVIYVKKSGVKESVFKALEPVSATDRAAGGHRFRPFGGGKSPEWFRTYKDFFLPSLVSSVQFLKSKLAIVLARGVEIMDLETLRTMTVPNFAPHRQDPVISALQKRCDDATTLGMFRIHENIFLLAYNDFAFQVDKHGEPIPGRLGLIEWESRPEQVAFYAPYIYAFSANLIEVRHAMTGELAQVIQGSQIALTYDGTGLDSGVVDIRSPSNWGYDDLPEKRIHFSMKVGAYHVLNEIAPTTPLPPRSPSIW